MHLSIIFNVNSLGTIIFLFAGIEICSLKLFLCLTGYIVLSAKMQCECCVLNDFGKFY